MTVKKRLFRVAYGASFHEHLDDTKHMVVSPDGWLFKSPMKEFSHHLWMMNAPVDVEATTLVVKK